MEILEADVKSVSIEMHLPFEEADQWFKFIINKKDHGFHVQILKTGKYIFISLVIGNQGFPIEHIEFYMKESKKDILEELTEHLQRLNRHESRVIEIQKRNQTNFKVETCEIDEWVQYGYPAKENLFKRLL